MKKVKIIIENCKKRGKIDVFKKCSTKNHVFDKSVIKRKNLSEFDVKIVIINDVSQNK